MRNVSCVSRDRQGMFAMVVSQDSLGVLVAHDAILRREN